MSGLFDEFELSLSGASCREDLLDDLGHQVASRVRQAVYTLDIF